MNVTDVEIIVIGAGISGIATASRLLENGFEKILILEAEDRIGGRVNTVQFGTHGLLIFEDESNCGMIRVGNSKVDLGGHWVGGEQGNPIYDLVKDLDVLTKTKDFSKIYFYHENGRLDQSIVDQLFASISNASNDTESLRNFKGNLFDYYKQSLSSCLDAVCPDDWFKHAFLNWFDHFHSFEKGCDTIKNASVSTLSRHQTCSGHQTLVWKQGFSTLIDILMKNHPNVKDNSKRLKNENIKLNSEVTNIKWSGENLTVLCSDGEVYNCDHVIVTVSVGVIKEKLDTLFTPPLPIAYQDAFNSLDMGPVEKIYLKFDKQWWPDDCSGFCFLSPTEDSWENKISGFFTEFGAPNILCAWTVGEAATATISDENVIKMCSKILKHHLGDKYDITEPSSILRSKWFSNSNFRGASSFRNLKCDDSNSNTSVLSKPIIHQDKPKIVFAGEATSEKFFSTTHGALESGWRAAQDLIDFYIKWPKVIIIGAGIAGLSAARTLIRGGIDDVKIFEACDVPGGRIKTLKCESHIIELGAQWIHSEETELYEIAKNEDLLSNIVSGEGLGVYVRPNGEVIPSTLVAEVKKEVEKILFECEKFQHDVSKCPKSVGDFLNEEFEKYLAADNSEQEVKKDIFSWNQRFQLIDNSCTDLKELSALFWGRYNSETPRHINFKKGYSSLVDALKNDIPQNCFLMSKPVRTVKWNSKLCYTEYPCELLCDDGDLWRSTHVIVTSSIGFLKENSNLFEPHLPIGHQQAINSIGFSTINKIFLEYEKPWWGELEGIQLAYSSPKWIEEFEDDEMEWTSGISGFDTIVDLPKFLLVWVGGGGALQMEKIPEEKLAEHCTSVLKRFLPHLKIPSPRKIYRSSWSSDKYARGSYSHIRVEGDKYKKFPVEILSKPISTINGNKTHHSLFFAGEAVHMDQYSTVHGAYESGKYQAEKILEFIKNTNFDSK